MKRADRKSSIYRGFGGIGGNILIEASAQRRGVNGGEDGSCYRSRRRYHSRRSSDKVVWSRKLDASNDKDERSPESDSGKTGEDNSINRIVRLDGGETDNAGSKDQEAGE